MQAEAEIQEPVHTSNSRGTHCNSLVVKVTKGKAVMSDVVQELSICEALSGHPHVVVLVDAWWLGKEAHFVFLHAGEPLAKTLKHPMEPNSVKPCFVQIASGLAFIHAHLVIHNDLKPANILLDRDKHVRIADFGCSQIDRLGWGLGRKMSDVAKHGVDEITIWYRAPEVLLGSLDHDRKVDVWSLGCILAEVQRLLGHQGCGSLAKDIFSELNNIGLLSRLYSRGLVCSRSKALTTDCMRGLWIGWMVQHCAAQLWTIHPLRNPHIQSVVNDLNI
jgi:serine/threonine protein kinase